MNIPLNIDWQQILLHLFNFAILAGGLYLLLFKPVKAFMEKRESYYKNIDAEAQKKLQDAEGLKDSYARRMQEADEEIAARKAQAQQEMERAREASLQSARDEAAQILDKARTASAQEHDRMLRDTQKELVEIATAAAEKVLKGGQGDPYEQFLTAAKREEPNA